MRDLSKLILYYLYLFYGHYNLLKGIKHFRSPSCKDKLKCLKPYINRHIVDYKCAVVISKGIDVVL